MPEGLRFGETGIGAADVDRQVLGSYTDEVYDRLWLFAGCGNGSTTTGRLVGRHPIETFPDGSTTGYAWALPVRQNWRNHYLRATFYYTSTGASTNNYSIRVAAWAMGPAINPTTGREIGDTTANYPGPAATTTQLSASLALTTSPVSIQTDTTLTLLVQRIGGTDANNNDFALLGVTVEAYRA